MRLTAFLLLILLCDFAIAQKTLFNGKGITVTQNGFNDDREGGDERIYYITERNVVTRQPMRGGLFVYRIYSPTMELIEEREIHRDETVPDRMDIPFLFEVNDKLYGIGAKTNSDNLRNEVFLLRWNEDQFKFSDNYERISVVEGENFFRNFDNAFLDVEVAQDESQILVSHKLPERGEFLVFRLLHFDGNMQLVARDDIELELDGIPFFPKGSSWMSRKGIPYTFGTGGNSPFEIDHEGVISTYGNKKKQEADWFVCTINEGRARYHKIHEDEDWFVRDISLRSPNNHPGKWLVGEYVDKAKDESGYCMFPIKGGRLGEPIEILWDNQTVGDFLLESQKKIDKRTAKGKKYDPRHAQLIQWLVADDGSMALIHEQNYSVTTTDQNGNRRTTYYSRGLIVSSVDKDGRLIGARGIRKAQASKNPKYQRSWVFEHNELIHIVFNDNFKNLKPNWDGQSTAAFGGPNNPVTMVQIDMKDLDFQTRELMWVTDDNNKIPIGPYTHRMYPMGPNRYIAWANAGARRCLLLFDLK